MSRPNHPTDQAFYKIVDALTEEELKTVIHGMVGIISCSPEAVLIASLRKPNAEYAGALRAALDFMENVSYANQEAEGAAVTKEP
jgi:hypothetical protein